MDSLTLDDLHVCFLELDTFEKEKENDIEFSDSIAVFGPSKA